LNPVNGLWAIASFLPPSKGGTNVPEATNFLQIPHLLLHCCNTRHAIEAEKHLPSADRL
jgi:hypothetical protein